MSEGMTGWEIISAKLRKKNKEENLPPELKVLNPFNLKIGDYVELDAPQFLGRLFVVSEVDYATYRVGSETFEYVDYILPDEKGASVTLRAYPITDPDPTAKKHCELIVLTTDKAFGWDADAEKFYKEILPVGTLGVPDDDGETRRVYTRLQNARNPYALEITVITARGAKPDKEYYDSWDYGRVVEGSTNEFYFVELNKTDGHRGEFQTFLGVPIDERDVKVRRRMINK